MNDHLIETDEWYIPEEAGKNCIWMTEEERKIYAWNMYVNHLIRVIWGD